MVRADIVADGKADVIYRGFVPPRANTWYTSGMNEATTSTADPVGRSWRISLAAVGFAIAAGVFLRIYNLDLKGLWLDEIYSVFALYSLPSFSSLWADYMATDSNSPFYELVLLAWTSIFGYSDFAVRMPNAVLGILAVAAMLFAVRGAVDRSVALSATILLAFSWPAIFYSQEVRSYSLVLFFSVLVTGLWLRILGHGSASTDRRRSYWALVALAPVLSYAHLYGFIFASFLWIYLIAADLMNKDAVSARRASFGLAVTVLSYLPWLTIMLRSMRQTGFLELPSYEAPGAQFFIDIGAFMYHHPVPAVLLGVGPILLGGPQTFRRIVTAVRARNLDEPFLALIFVVVIPFAAVFIFSQVKPMLYTRYLMVFVPAGVLFTALAFEEFRLGLGWRRHVALVVAGLISLAWVLPDHYRFRSKPQTREAAQFILETFDPATDTVLAPCNPSPNFSCIYDVGHLSPRLSRYVHYLNYQTLPDFPLRPDSFASIAEAGE